MKKTILITGSTDGIGQITSRMLLAEGHKVLVHGRSAAQAPVNMKKLQGASRMSNDEAYAQSKLALTIWSFKLGKEFAQNANGPMIVAVNPKSFLGSKMVKTAYGVAGHDLRIGGDILCRAALSDEFANASGKYFDNDRGIFSMPHPDALDSRVQDELVGKLEEIYGLLV